MPLNIGELIARVTITGTGQAASELAGVRGGFVDTGAAAERAGSQVRLGAAAFTAAGRQAEVGAAGSAKYRQAVLLASAAQMRLNEALAKGGAAQSSLARMEATNVAAQERLRRATGQTTTAITAQSAAAREATAASTAAAGGMRGMLVNGVKLAAGLGVVYGGFELVKKSIDIAKEAASFQREMLLIQTQARASAGEVKDMTKAVLQMAPSVATGPEALSKSLYHLESVGLHGSAALGVLKIAAEGAKVSNSDLEQTTNALTATVVSGIGGVHGMSQAMGELNTIVGAGDMRMNDLNEALGTGILAFSKGFGITLQQVGAALATFGDNNIRGAESATRLRQAITDMVKPAAGADAWLVKIGITSDQLTSSISEHGLTGGLDLLHNSLVQSGMAANEWGVFLTHAFTKRAGPALATLIQQWERYHQKLDQITGGGESFAAAWAATTKTVSFAWQSLQARLETVGIVLATKLNPALAGVAHFLTGPLVTGISTVVDAMQPMLHVVAGGLVAAWAGLSVVLGVAAAALNVVGGYLKQHHEIISYSIGPVLALWAAWKGYQVVRMAASAVMSALTALRNQAAMSGAALRSVFSGKMPSGYAGFMAQQAAVSRSTALSVEADAAVRAAAEQRLALAVAEGELAQREAMAATALQAAETAEMEGSVLAEAAMSTAISTDEMVAQQRALVLSMRATSVAATATAETTGLAAKTAATDIQLAGASARVGWVGLLGPLALAGMAVGLVVSMFHRSSSASKEATDAAKNYTDVFAKGGGRSAVLDEVRAQLKDKDIPNEIARLNDLLGKTALNGAKFAEAIASGGRPLSALRAQLNAVVTTGESNVRRLTAAELQYGVAAGRSGGQTAEFTKHQAAMDRQIAKSNDAVNTAKKLLKQLGVERNGLTKAQNTNLIDTKELYGAASAIESTTTAAQVGTEAAKRYAQMLGYEVNKDGIVAATSQNVLDQQVQAVSLAFGTATMAGNDYLNALQTFSTSAMTAADRAAMIGAVLKAGNGDMLGYAGAITNATEAHRQLTDEMQSAATSAYPKIAAETGGAEVALRKYGSSLVNATNGAIHYKARGAAQLVSGLQAIQDAAMKAAEATYQHNLKTESGTQAAQDAYNVYKSSTQAQLIDEAKKLGISGDAAKRLAEKYFGIPKDVKTKIAQVGGDSVSDILKTIRDLLKGLVGLWSPKVNVDAGNTLSTLYSIRNTLGEIVRYDGASVHIGTGNVGQAAGGVIPAGLSTVGERGWELVSTDTHGNSRVFSHGQSMAMTGKPDFLPGFASGTASNQATILGALRGIGLTNNQAAGFMGNFQTESKFSPTAHNAGEGAHGIAQWEGSRWSALERYAKAHSESATSLTAQLGFLRQELKAYPAMMHEIKASNSPAKVAAIVDAQYERSDGRSRGQRQANARRIAADIKSGKVSASGSADGVVPAAASNIKFAVSKLGNQLLSSVHSTADGLSGTYRSAAASMKRVVKSATSHVNSAIAASVAGDPSTPQGWAARLKGQMPRAVTAQQHAEIAGTNLATLQKHYDAQVKHVAVLKQLAAETKKDAQAAAHAAAAMPAHTAAQKAAKAAAESHAAALKRSAEAQTAHYKLAAAESATSKKALTAAKDAYSKLKSAADEAAKAAEETAKALVDSVKSQIDALQQEVSQFTDTITQGLIGGASLGGFWTDLATSAQTAADNLKSAQEAVDAASRSASAAQNDLAAAQTRQAAAHTAFVQAHRELQAAQAGGDPAAIAAAQARQTAVAQDLTTANNSLADATTAVGNAAGPTADELNALTAAQAANSQASGAASAGGLQAKMAGLLASVKAFAGDLTKLQQMGAGQDLLSQIAGLGPDAGDALAKALIAAGPGTLSDLQSTMDQIANVAGTAAGTLASGYFGAGTQSMKDYVAGISKQFPAVKAALGPLAAQLKAMFTFTPTVSVPASQNVKLTAASTIGALASKYGTTVAVLEAMNSFLSGKAASYSIAKGTTVVVPKFAAGVRDFAGGLALVGERGPELVSLPSHSTVHPNGNVIDITPLLNRLDAIESHLAVAPERTGRAVGDATLAGYTAAGTAQARKATRLYRKGV